MTLDACRELAKIRDRLRVILTGSGETFGADIEALFHDVTRSVAQRDHARGRCVRPPVDWRARALEAEGEIERLRATLNSYRTAFEAAPGHTTEGE